MGYGKLTKSVVLRSDTEEAVDWVGIDPYAAARLKRVVESWIGTPYRPHQRIKGVGCDCKELVAGILDEMTLKGSPTTIPRRSPNVATHFPEKAIAVISAMVTAYDADLIDDGTIETGDVIVTRSSANPFGPPNGGHIMLAWLVPGTVVDIINQGRARISSIENNRGILGIYRLPDKDTWA